MSPRLVHCSGSIYSAEAIGKAIRAFADLCDVRQANDGDGVELMITVRDGAPSHAAEELLNYMLCAAVEEHVAAQ